jgi:hypothetical protein
LQGQPITSFFSLSLICIYYINSAALPNKSGNFLYLGVIAIITGYSHHTTPHHNDGSLAQCAVTPTKRQTLYCPNIRKHEKPYSKVFMVKYLDRSRKVSTVFLFTTKSDKKITMPAAGFEPR